MARTGPVCGSSSTATGSSRRTRTASTRSARRPDAARGGRGAGERLAVDALANAIGPVFPRRADPARVAVAMSGGVDSAVALLRAGPDAVGVTLGSGSTRTAPDSERACCSPEAVIAARETCHRLGLPHVTLDAREAFRRAIVEPFVDGYARGETPNPCTRCNGSFRFASCSRSRAAPGPRGSRPATTRGSSSIGAGSCSPARVDEQKDQSYMLAATRPAAARADLVPARRADEGGDARRGGARRARGRAAAPRARRRASWAAATTATSSSGTACRPARAPIVDEDGSDARHATRASGASRRASAGGSASSTGRAAATRSAATRARTRVVVGAARVACPPRRARLRPAVRVGHAGRREAPLPIAGCRRPTWRHRRRVPPPSSTSPPTASRPARPPFSTRATSSSAPGIIGGSRARN